MAIRMGDEAKSHLDSPEAWSRCAEVLKEHDDARVQAWRDDIDTLLVFAGLFSGVLTAFNVQLYSLLQQDPYNAQLALLAQISAHLKPFSTNGTETPTNQLGPPLVLPLGGLQTSGSAVRTNTLMFASLICSLSAAFMSILVKQWLNQYTNALSSTSREGSRLRQFRDDGFIRWRVSRIIALLPALLQVALALFFAGLLDFLWSLNRRVAIVSTVLVAIFAFFLVVTLLLPVFVADCPYQTTQALGIFTTLNAAKYMTQSWSLTIRDILDPWLLGSSLREFWRANIFTVLSAYAREPVYYRWEDRERDVVRDLTESLDERSLKTADRVRMDDMFLEDVIAPCMQDMGIASALSVFEDVMLRRAEYSQDGLAVWHSNDIEHKAVVTLPMLHLGIDALVIVSQDSNRKHQQDIFRVVNSMWTTWHRPRILQPSTLTRLRNLLRALHSASFLWRDRYFIFLQIYETLSHADNIGDFGMEGVKILAACFPALRTEDTQYRMNNMWTLFSASQLLIRIATSCDPRELTDDLPHIMRKVLHGIEETITSAHWEMLQPLARLRLLAMIIPDLLILAQRDHALIPYVFVTILGTATTNIKAPPNIDEDLWTTETSSLAAALRELASMYPTKEMSNT